MNYGFELCNCVFSHSFLLADLHPWNVMMDKNEQHVSFLVFVYGLMTSLVLIKILSWWNFMVYLAFGFLIYSFGGPYLVFKWLVISSSIVELPHDFFFLGGEEWSGWSENPL